MSFKLRPLFTKIFRNSSECQKDSYRYLSFFKRTRKKISEPSNYIISLAPERDHFTILKLMQEAYYPDEPTCASIGVQSNPVMQERARKFLREGLSLVARCKYDNCIVGACINCSIQPWDPNLTEKLACSVRDENVRTLLLFYAHVTRFGDLWRCYDTKKIFEMAYVFVKPEHRRMGISSRLLDESMKLGADCGYPVVRYDATNYKTALICQKLGMELVDAIPYCSYLGRNYEPVFRPPHPNESVKIYIKTFIPVKVE